MARSFLLGCALMILGLNLLASGEALMLPNRFWPAAVSPNGNYLAFAVYPETHNPSITAPRLQVWDLNQNKRILAMQLPRVRMHRLLRFGPNNGTLLAKIDTLDSPNGNFKARYAILLDLATAKLHRACFAYRSKSPHGFIDCSDPWDFGRHDRELVYSLKQFELAVLELGRRPRRLMPLHLQGLEPEKAWISRDLSILAIEDGAELDIRSVPDNKALGRISIGQNLVDDYYATLLTAYSPDSRWLLSGRRTKTPLTLSTLPALKSQILDPAMNVVDAAFDPQSRKLLSIEVPLKHRQAWFKLRIRDLASGRLIAEHQPTTVALDIRFPLRAFWRGEQACVAVTDGHVYCWHPSKGTTQNWNLPLQTAAGS